MSAEAETPVILTAGQEEAIAFNLCSLHGFDPAFVTTQRDFALAVIKEYERARQSLTADPVSSNWRRIRPDNGPWDNDLAWPEWAEGEGDLLVFNHCDGFHVWRRNFSIPPGTWATTLREPSEMARPHPVPEDDDKPRWVVRVMEAREEYEGEGFWEACSGCQESIDGQVSQKDYPYSAVFGCQPGGGCGDCGGLGVKWNNTDYDALARSIMADVAEEEFEADRARIAVEALEPFAKGAAHRTMPGLSPTYKVADFGDGVFVTVADFRRAAGASAALKSGSKS